MSILVATDLSEHSRPAIRYAFQLAGGHRELHVVHVVDNLGDDELWTALLETPDEIEERVLKGAIAKTEAFVKETLSNALPDHLFIRVAFGPPHREIWNLVEEHGITNVVSGTTGHGRFHNAIFGSTAARVVRHATRPITFVHDDDHQPPHKKVIVPLDLSLHNAAVLEHAAAIAPGAELVIVHALGVSIFSDDYDVGTNYTPTVQMIAEERRAILEQLARESSTPNQVRVVVSKDMPHVAIAEIANEIDADLICMGTHRHGVLSRAFIGSNAERVLRTSELPVTIVPLTD